MNSEEADRPAKERHSSEIDAWIKQNSSGLSCEQLLAFFGKAIESTQKRTATILSEVTLTAIMDRVLSTSQKRFPLLSGVQIRSSGISVASLMPQAKDLKPEEIEAAFRFLLIELLTLLGHLTAEVLTETLYQELFKVTADRTPPEVRPGHRGLRSVRNSSDRGDA